MPNGSYSNAGLTPDLLMSLQGLAGLDMHGNGSSNGVLQVTQPPCDALLTASQVQPSSLLVGKHI